MSIKDTMTIWVLKISELGSRSFGLCFHLPSHGYLFLEPRPSDGAGTPFASRRPRPRGTRIGGLLGEGRPARAFDALGLQTLGMACLWFPQAFGLKGLP